MSAPSPTVSTEQYEAATKKIVSSIHRRIGNTAAEALAEATHRSPMKVGRALAVAANAFDDVDPDVLDRALSDKLRFFVVLQEALRSLDRSVLASEPDRGRLVLGDGVSTKPLSAAAGREPLTETAEEVGDEDRFYATLSTTEAGARLDVSRQTINEWVAAGKLIGLRGAKRGVRVPKAQIRRGKPAPSLSKVLEAMGGDHELAWDFLVAGQVIDGQSVQPLALLFAGRTNDVARLASGYGRDVL